MTLATGAAQPVHGRGRGHVVRFILVPLLVAGVLACGEPAAVEPPGRSPGASAGERDADSLPGDRAGAMVRPGDCLLELLGGARVVNYPNTNLRPEVAALAGESLLLEMAVPVASWSRVEAIPDDWRELLGARESEPLWWAWPPETLLPQGKRPSARIGGRPVEAADPSGALPERFAFWYPAAGLILANGSERPGDVSLVARVAAADALGAWERGESLTGSAPDAAALRTRHALGGVQREGLLLPSPAVLEFDIEQLDAERLHLALGLVDRGWNQLAGSEVVRRAPAHSDGVRCAVEVVTRSEAGAQPSPARRVWSVVLEGQAEDLGWLEASVDLSPWRGQSITLRLLTEPGAAGDTLHDYAVWSGLRFRGGDVGAPPRPHVVLIDIDTLRADRLAAYGARRPTTPRLDAWARERGTVFTDSVSTAPWTLPSTVSMLTGLAVHQHGVDEATKAMSPTTPTLASLLTDAGYEARAITAGGYLRPTYGCDAGFEVYETREPKDLDWSAALDFVRNRDSERPFLLFLHTYIVHAPYPLDVRFGDGTYDGPLAGAAVDTHTVFEPANRGELILDAADLAYVEQLYDAQVAHMDAALGDFLEQLNASVAADDLLVLLTSDHGEAFGEHGRMGHGGSLHEEMMRVPLVVQFPGGRAGRRAVPASGVDLLPTILHELGLPIPEGLAGRALTAAPAEAVRVAQSGADLRAAWSDGDKLIEARSEAGFQPVGLYHLPEDPSEHTDLAASETARLKALRRRLEWYLATHPRPADGGPVDSSPAGDGLAELRALGYVGDN